MFFSVDNAEDFASEISLGMTAEEQKFYRLVNLHSNLRVITKLEMFCSDLFNMVKMVHLKKCNKNEN
jgi:hypothetical protein